jgi:glycosyltransferase involved in cell wall biosynthesis
MVKINWVCFGSPTGYSQAAQDMIFALNATGKYDIRVQYILHRQIQKEGMSSARQLSLNLLTEKEKTQDHIQVYHCIPSVQHLVHPSVKNLGYAMFETFNPPNEGKMNWIQRLNRMDGIIAPSLFNYKIFANEKIEKPLHYVPCCYDIDSFNPQVEPLEKYDRFTFLYFGTWKRRKGYPLLIEAFCREFSDSDPVQLLIKTDKPKTAITEVSALKKTYGLDKKNIAPILFEERVLDDEVLPRFMKSANCLISPTLGEGFGLPGLQCMALGVPVAITDFSGCKDYANEQTSTLIKPAGFVLHEQLDNLPQFTKKKWAHITCSELQRVMRHVYTNKVEIDSKAAYGAEFVKQQFSYAKAAEAFAVMLRETFNV